mmetsp:Transcript_30797/g.62885  ORF Transcript_30797/g.62885 Transcript_30797/m.62885 type:complete len:338 (-) Transcript_30797:196-1209(-)
MEEGVRRSHHDAIEEFGKFGGLGTGEVHDGRDVQRGGGGGVQSVPREGTALQGEPAGELVVRAQVGHLRHRGGLHRPRGPDLPRGQDPQGQSRRSERTVRIRHAHLLRVSHRGGRRRRRRGLGCRHHASGNDAGRYRRRHPSRGSAIRPPSRQARRPSLRRSTHPHRLRRDARGHGIRNRSREDHPGARPERLRVRQASRFGIRQRPQSRRKHQRTGESIRGDDEVRRPHRCGGGPEGEGIVQGEGPQQDEAGTLLALRRRTRTSHHAPVVRQLRRHGQEGDRRGPKRGIDDTAEGSRTDVVSMVGQHQGLVRESAVVVGTSDTGVVRHQEGRGGGG